MGTRPAPRTTRTPKLVPPALSGILASMVQLNFYVDIDDVLSETTRALALLAQTRFGKAVTFENMRVFDLSVSLGLNAEELPAFMAAAHAPDFLLGLEPMPGAAEALTDWQSDGARISVVTGRPPESREATLRWLEERGIPFDDLEFVDKYRRFNDPSALTPGDLLTRDYDAVIEDADSMADYLVLHTDARVLLYDRPWNQDSIAEAHGAQRVRGWAEIRRSMATVRGSPTA
ncbi:MAG TPA: bifunctional metallophosphatase/5'-nucleotidase [Myxococcales bacterium]|nr:bifunctional metallophosphatase/5'-nucleotidase [Myxococcales bacterium]HIL00554.1 bifunctional metallophosphatase/5'-nucleotidase [Myxococcales bacterium]